MPNDHNGNEYCIHISVDTGWSSHSWPGKCFENSHHEKIDAEKESNFFVLFVAFYSCLNTSTGPKTICYLECRRNVTGYFIIHYTINSKYNCVMFLNT